MNWSINLIKIKGIKITAEIFIETDVKIDSEKQSNYQRENHFEMYKFENLHYPISRLTTELQ